MSEAQSVAVKVSATIPFILLGAHGDLLVLSAIGAVAATFWVRSIDTLFASLLAILFSTFLGALGAEALVAAVVHRYAELATVESLAGLCALSLGGGCPLLWPVLLRWLARKGENDSRA